MYIARKNASTVDERSTGVDSQDPFAASEIPVAGAILNPLVASTTSQAGDRTVAQLNTTTVGYGAFGTRDLSDHYKFTAEKDKTYALVVSTDSSNGNIRTEAYADYFDIYFEDAAGNRVTADFQIKELDLYTKLVEYKAPAAGTYYVQVDNAFEQPFEYAIALIDKSKAPAIAVTSQANGAGGFLVTFSATETLSTTRPRLDRIEVAGGTLSALTRGADGKSYTATFTPAATSAEGTSVEPSVKVLTGAFFSRAGDFNLDGGEANNAVVPKIMPPAGGGADGGTGGGTGGGAGGGTGGGTPANVAPTLTLTVEDIPLGPNSTPLVQFKFSEAVKDFSSDDVTVTGGRLVGFTGEGDTYTARLELLDAPQRPEDGKVQLTVGKGYTDLMGLAPSAAVLRTVSFDLTGISVIGIEAAIEEIRPGQSTTVTIRFSEAVTAFDLDALIVGGGTAANLRSIGTDGRAFEFDLLADTVSEAAKVITVALDSSRVLDAVGNPLVAAPAFELPLDLSGLRVLGAAQVDLADPDRVTTRFTHSNDKAPILVYLQSGDSATGLAIAAIDPASKTFAVPFTPQDQVLTGEIRITDGSVSFADGIVTLDPGESDLSLGLTVVLGTDSQEGDAASGNDSLVAVSDLPVALYGFGGNDSLIEGATTVLMNGGDGVDTYEMQPGAGSTLVVDTGSMTTMDVLFGFLGLVPSYAGFDLITGFDIGSDTFRFAGKTASEHKTVVGVYDTTLLVFTPDPTGSDVMVYLDGEDGTEDQFDDGELAVVIVGAAQAVKTPAIGGNGE